MQLLVDDIDNLSRDGFDWIIQKVIFKVGKVRFDPFPISILFSGNEVLPRVIASCSFVSVKRILT